MSRENQDIGYKFSRRDFIKRSLAGLSTLPSFLAIHSLLESSSKAEKLIQKAEESYPFRYKPERMEEAIACYKEADKILGSDLSSNEETKLARTAKNRLSQLSFEKPGLPGVQGKVEKIDYEGNKKEFKEGKKFGIESLKLNPKFLATYKGNNYVEAINQIGKENYKVGKGGDVPAIFWFACNLSILADLKLQGIVSFLLNPWIVNDITKIIDSYMNVENLERDYMGGSALSSLGTTYASIHQVPGAEIYFSWVSMKKSEELFTEAIQEDKTFLANRVAYAGEFAPRTKKKEKERGKEIFEEQLSQVLSYKNKEEMIDKWPYWNRASIEIAEYLKEQGYQKVRKEKSKVSLF